MPNFNMDSISDYVKNHPYETAAGVAGAVATPVLAYKYRRELLNPYYSHKANQHATEVLSNAGKGILGTKVASMEKLAHEEIVAYLAEMKGVDFEKIAASQAQLLVRRMLSRGKTVNAFTGRIAGHKFNANKPQTIPPGKSIATIKQAPQQGKTIKSPEQQPKPQANQQPQQPQQPQQSQQPQQQPENKGFSFSKRTKTLATLGAAAGGTGAVVGHMVGGSSDRK